MLNNAPRSSLRSSSSGTVEVLLLLLWFGSEIWGQQGELGLDSSASVSSQWEPNFFDSVAAVIPGRAGFLCSSS